VGRRPIAVAFIGLAIIGVLSLYGIGWTLSRAVPRQIGRPPAEFAATAIVFDSQSGSAIHGWLSRRDQSFGTVLLLPAVRENRLSMVPRAKFLREAGYSTLLIDLQATGESPGEVITFGWRERLDVLAAVRFLHQHLPGEKVAIVGISLGGAAALLAAPELAVQAVVVEAVYPSIDIAVENRLRMRIGPAGSALAPLLLLPLHSRIGADRQQLRPVDHIGQLRCPVFVIGGAEDLHTREADTRLLYDAARHPKQLWLIPGAAHVDYFDALGEEYRRRLLAFLADALDRGRDLDR
jgi:alpha-beta hydrolase superfamily lysophospholipase